MTCVNYKLTIFTTYETDLLARVTAIMASNNATVEELIYYRSANEKECSHFTIITKLDSQTIELLRRRMLRLVEVEEIEYFVV